MLLLCALTTLTAANGAVTTTLHDDMVTFDIIANDGKEITILFNHRKTDEIPTIIFRNYKEVESFNNKLISIREEVSETAFIGECSTAEKDFPIKDYKVIPQEFLDKDKDHKKAWKESYKEMDELLKTIFKKKKIDLLIDNPKKGSHDRITLNLEPKGSKAALKTWNKFKESFYE